MTLKDLLKKKDKVQVEASEQPTTTSKAGDSLAVPEAGGGTPEFTFLRTTTNTQEVIALPAFPGDPSKAPEQSQSQSQSPPSKHHSRFRRHTNAAHTDAPEYKTLELRPKQERRLSERLLLRSRSSSASTTSVNIPANLPPEPTGVAVTGQEEEALWEKRATVLAKSNPNNDGIVRLGSAISLSDRKGDENIQEAIRLHEEGDLGQSTSMFGRLANPQGANNALSQVLYGLALRHGWGITKDETRAVTYLSYAASNSADIESLALQAGMKKGGAAKGELTLAIFELANCFRNGWGVKRDPIAAKQYYETAANMGDTDGMNEVAWCYLEGFGCKKDKYKAAQYLRLAEEKGVKTLGNTWIWKDKYGGLKKSENSAQPSS